MADILRTIMEILGGTALYYLGRSDGELKQMVTNLTERQQENEAAIEEIKRRRAATTENGNSKP